MTKTKFTILLLILCGSFISNGQTNNPLYQANGKWGFDASRGRYFNKKLPLVLEAKYDSIIQVGVMVAAKKGGLWTMYQLGGQEPVDSDLLDVAYTPHVSQDGIQVLSAYGIYWFDRHGGETMEKPKAEGMCGTVAQLTCYILRQNGNYVLYKENSYSRKEGETIILAPLSRYSALEFLDGGTMKTFNGNAAGGFRWSLWNDIFRFRRNGVNGIAELKEGNFKEVFQAAAKTKMMSGKESPIYLIKGYGNERRYGYWPMNTKAKYYKMGNWNGAYISIEKEDGSRGWLKLDGTEFIP